MPDSPHNLSISFHDNPDGQKASRYNVMIWADEFNELALAMMRRPHSGYQSVRHSAARSSANGENRAQSGNGIAHQIAPSRPTRLTDQRGAPALLHVPHMRAGGKVVAVRRVRGGPVAVVR